MIPQIGKGAQSSRASDADERALEQEERRHQQRPSIIKLQSIQWKILSIALFSAIGFFSYLIVVSEGSSRNAELLKNIRDTRYPTQAALLSSLHELKMIQYQLLQVAITGDHEALFEVDVARKTFQKHITNAIERDPESAGKLTGILEEFQRYYYGAKQLAHDMAMGLFDKELLRARSHISGERYKRLVDALTNTQAEQNHAFTSSVSEATRRADDSVMVVYAAGMLTALAIIGWALFTAQRIQRSIRTMVSTLRGIARREGNLSSRIRLRGHDEMTELAFWFNTFIDKLERVSRESTAEIKRIAFTDNLSGLANRRLFMETLKRSLQQMDKAQEQLAIIFIDLDNFKPVNDLYGHETGDALIKAVSQGLLRILRGGRPEGAMDVEHIPLDQPMAARIGGDEFLIMLPRVKGPDEVEAVARAVLEFLTEPLFCNGHQCNIGASLGIGLFPDNEGDDSDAAEIVDKADVAMYESKKNGKNTYRFYNKALADSAERLVQLDGVIQSMLKNEEFLLAYQPKFDLQSGGYAGAEALIRWQSALECGFTPAELIAHAEQRGQIYAIDMWVLNCVCAQIKSWQSQGYEIGRIALNISAKQARRPDLCELVQHKLDAHGVSAQYLEFEITETSALEHLSQVVSNIQKLRDMSATVAIDDFGAGHSSLQLLIKHPVDSIKIDRTLTEQLHSDKRSRSIVAMLASLGKALKMRVIAEGIETREQLKVLHAMGCDQGQGYLLARPMAADKITKFMPKQGQHPEPRQALG